MSEILDVLIEPDRTHSSGLFVVDLESLARQVNFGVAIRQIVSIPANGSSGNHKHPRMESFLCPQRGVEFHWLDKEGTHHSADMIDENGKLHLFIAGANTPHAIKNTNEHSIALFEFADGEQREVEAVQVIV